MSLKEQGIILFNTMMLISLFTLLVLSQMHSILLQLKANNHYQERHHSFSHLEALTAKLLKTQKKKDCMVPAAEPNRIIEKLKAREGCSVIENDQHYYFLIEDLGEFPCLQIPSHNTNYSTRQWRLTVAQIKPLMVVQVRIATPIPYIRCNQSPLLMIKSGLMSWRFIG